MEEQHAGRPLGLNELLLLNTLWRERWLTADDAAHHIQKPVAKARAVVLHDFDQRQQEQLVLKYVEQHGRITRSEATELCRIGPYQASRLLKRLVEEGELVRRGQGRGTWYERAPSS